MRKKLFLPILILIALLSVFLYINNNSKQESNDPEKDMSLTEKIDAFTHAEYEDKGIQVETLELQKDIDGKYKAVLFTQKNGNIGYALLKNDKVVSVTSGDGKEFEHPNNDYFFLYGEKPNENVTKLKAKIAVPNHPDVEKTFDLTDEKYYLVYYKLPEKDIFAKVLDEPVFE